MMGSRSKAKALGVPKGLRILYASETSAHLNCNCLAKGKARRLPAKLRISPEKHGNHGCNGSCEAAKATAKAKYRQLSHCGGKVRRRRSRGGLPGVEPKLKMNACDLVFLEERYDALAYR
jgi:hypothetical protein